MHIVRYPHDKENITGYQFEPWHIRYVGKSAALEIAARNITLEEYLGRV
jgi:D-alanyl-D-alanine carboxypeptidase